MRVVEAPVDFQYMRSQSEFETDVIEKEFKTAIASKSHCLGIPLPQRRAFSVCWKRYVSMTSLDSKRGQLDADLSAPRIAGFGADIEDAPLVCVSGYANPVPAFLPSLKERLETVGGLKLHKIFMNGAQKAKVNLTKKELSRGSFPSSRDASKFLHMH